jgi:hypothetical protein
MLWFVNRFFVSRVCWKIRIQKKRSRVAFGFPPFCCNASGAVLDALKYVHLKSRVYEYLASFQGITLVGKKKEF